MGNEKKDPQLIPLKEEFFYFRCYRGIKCFTTCCAALNLVLTPYDILCLKKRLNVTSEEFLTQYTDTRLGEHARFPLVSLKMNQDPRKTCPFVTGDGCRIYEDRPSACRIYPLGRAALKVDEEKKAREKFFLVQEEHCLGFQEDKKWHIQDWIDNEGLKEYNEMNDRWLEITTSPKSLGHKETIPRKIQMFSMASYNIDKFRSFIFKSRFLDLFELSTDLRHQLASDDLALLKFSIDWLKFSLFGEKTIPIKQTANSTKKP